MKINTKLNPQDSLYHDAKSMLGIITTASETTTLPLLEFFRSANEWLKQTTTWIWQSQASWLYDDKNQTDFPWATTTLVAAQQDYALPTTAQRIERVEVLDNAGEYQLIQPATREWITAYAMSEYYKTDGLPAFYILEGNSILLYPAPAAADVTLAAGLKTYFSRDVVDFAITATATTPGFSENFHRIISTGAALDFAYSRNMTNTIPPLINKINLFKSDLQEYYSKRHPDIKTQFRVIRESTI